MRRVSRDGLNNPADVLGDRLTMNVSAASDGFPHTPRRHSRESRNPGEGRATSVHSPHAPFSSRHPHRDPSTLPCKAVAPATAVPATQGRNDLLAEAAELLQRIGAAEEEVEGIDTGLGVAVDRLQDTGG